MSPDVDGPVLRVLGPADRRSAVDVAGRSFDGNRFYESALGLGADGFGAYWEEFFRLALGSRHARVYGIEDRRGLRGMIVAAFKEFPEPERAARFLAALWRRIGTRRCLRYFRFVHAYDRAMRGVERNRSREARCLWLMVAPGAGRRLGPALVREVRAALGREGMITATGFINAGDPRIVAFYRRLGFTVGSPFPFRGGHGATIEIPTGPEPRIDEAAPC